jgi:hypothetical protein
MTEMFGGSVPSSYRRRRDMESATFDPLGSSLKCNIDLVVMEALIRGFVSMSLSRSVV